MSKHPLLDTLNYRIIKVSAKSCRLKFIACGPDCIKKKNCKSKCCDAPTHPDGIRVFVSDNEIKPLERLGAAVKGNFIMPAVGARVCPFKAPSGLCSLFNKPQRPLGCIVSPFMLNKNDTLIVRNRYKLLPCYDNENGKPAYEVFSSSLVTIFGIKKFEKIKAHLDSGNGDLMVRIKSEIYNKLSSREDSLKGTKK